MSENEKKPTGKHEALQALKFTLFSISAGIIQIGTYTLFYEVFHWAPWLAYLVSLILSVLWNFTFNKSANNVPIAMLKVALFYVVFTPLSTWWTAALTGENPFTGAAASAEPLVNNYIVQAGTMLINFVTEFLFYRFVVFGKSIDTAAGAGKNETKNAAALKCPGNRTKNPLANDTAKDKYIMRFSDIIFFSLKYNNGPRTEAVAFAAKK